jgi:3-hydroxyisobutyrate dehydrogenase
MREVAVVGLGAMGSRIARRLLDAGYRVTVWNRSPGPVELLAGLGALAVAAPAEAAARVRTLITMVSDPAALRAVTEGPRGVAAGAHQELTIIEMSTIGPAALARLAMALPGGTGLVDAPVLGSLHEAETGALTIFTGGLQSRISSQMPVLSRLGTVIHTGPLGSGAAAKLIANLALFSALGAVGEAIAFGRALGLSSSALAEVLAVTPLASQAAKRWSVIEAGVYPKRFALSLARKDAGLIGKAARDAGVKIRLASTAQAWLTDAEAAGWGDYDYTAMLAAILRQRYSTQNATTGTSASRKASTATSRENAYDGLIVDLDGVVWRGAHSIDGAADAIATLRAAGMRIVFLTNDPQATRAQQAARLTAMGIPAAPDDVVTSAWAAARYLATCDEVGGSSVLVCGPPALREEVKRAGIRLVPRGRAREAELVIIGGHERFSYAELRAATIAVASGARLFATGRDVVVPALNGPEPATGAILAAVEAATGVTATVIGKPEPYIFGLARQSLKDCQRIAVVGDNMASDITGAKRAGLEALLVLTGATTRSDLARYIAQPDWVFPSLAALGAEFDGRAS